MKILVAGRRQNAPAAPPAPTTLSERGVLSAGLYTLGHINTQPPTNVMPLFAPSTATQPYLNIVQCHCLHLRSCPCFGHHELISGSCGRLSASSHLNIISCMPMRLAASGFSLWLLALPSFPTTHTHSTTVTMCRTSRTHTQRQVLATSLSAATRHSSGGVRHHSIPSHA